MPLLSVIIPVYNESKTISQILNKIMAVDIDKEIIVVDDGSGDGTDRVLMNLSFPGLKVIHHTSNRGKGAAFLTGLSHATGDYVIIQDADMEYDPADYRNMLETIQNSGTDLLLGVRPLKTCSGGLPIHIWGNRFLTGLLNLVFGSRLQDYATCYKLAKRQTWYELNLRATGFDIDVETVCNALKKKKKIAEVPVAYYPRSYNLGKKIRWTDGVWAIFYIFKYRLMRQK